MGAGASACLAAVLEYLCAENLELAGNVVHDNKKAHIVPHHITLAVQNAKEMNELLGGITIASGVFLPSIHAVLLPKKPSKESLSTTYMQGYADASALSTTGFSIIRPFK